MCRQCNDWCCFFFHLCVVPLLRTFSGGDLVPSQPQPEECSGEEENRGERGLLSGGCTVGKQIPHPRLAPPAKILFMVDDHIYTPNV